MEQNYKNHTRFYPAFHFGLIPLALIFAIFCFIQAFQHPSFHAFALAGAFCLILLVGFFARTFALKAQDRAIRAEANLRHFVLTGKLLPGGLTMGQIVALRFASDEECCELTDRAVAGNMKSSEIKSAIKSWKGDRNRV